jgi:putative addiction module killer protein
MEIRKTALFLGWYASLRDAKAKAAIARRIERAAAGNLGDVQPVGEGVSEMRVHVGAGYRVYFVTRGAVAIILLCGGDKSSQAADIRRALEISKEV